MTSPTTSASVSDADREVLRQMDLSTIMALEDPSDEYIYKEVEYWHSLVALWLLRHPIGATINLNDITAFIRQRLTGDLHKVQFAYRGQLRRLADAGWVRIAHRHVILLRSLPGDSVAMVADDPADGAPVTPRAHGQLSLFDT